MTANSPDQITRERLSQERMVLDDIHRRTGLKFHHLASIDRNQVEVMDRILPIIKEWINTGPEEIREALYFSFLTPAALPYLDDTLAWAQRERSSVSREVLTQVMRLIVTPKTASRIWEVYKGLAPTDSDPMLFSKLAAAASVSDQVVERILEFLRSVTRRIDHGERVRGFALGPLQEYSRVRHPKVREWFSHYLESPDPDLRGMARRSSGIKPMLPEGCRVVRGTPDHSRVVLSTEIDSDRLSHFMRDLERDLGAEFVSGLQPTRVAENLTERSWIVSDVLRSKRGPLELWLRLEDSTTVEVWVVAAPATRPS